jgi:hypothetical protein
MADCTTLAAPLADLDAEVVRAFDDAYQRAVAGKR